MSNVVTPVLLIYNQDMTLEIFLYVFAGILLILVGILFFSLRNTSARINELRQAQQEDKALLLMQQQIGQLTNNLNQQLHSMNQQFHGLSKHFQKTTGQIGTTLGDVEKDMGRMQEVTREVLEKAKDISNLENLLRAPKFRGGLGELFLGDLLAQILPPAHYTLQHKFKSGDMVDAVIRIGHHLVPIDSKFPLENFKKYTEENSPKEKNDLRKKFITDVKHHISEIAKKYILPDESTYDFALMYIPAENIYYETILKDENFGGERSLFSYSNQKRVIPVSPNSFYAYLQVIVLGLKGLQIEKSALTILQNLTRLQGDLGRFRRDFGILGSHLVNAKSKFEEADKRLDRLEDKLELAGGEATKPIHKAENGETLETE